MVKRKKKVINLSRLVKQILTSIAAYIFPIALAFFITALTWWITGKDSVHELFSKFVFNDILFAVLSSIFITYFIYSNGKEKIELLGKKFGIITVVLLVICLLILICLFVVAVAEGLEIEYAFERKEKMLPFVLAIETLSCVNSCLINCFCHSEYYLVRVKK